MIIKPLGDRCQDARTQTSKSGLSPLSTWLPSEVHTLLQSCSPLKLVLNSYLRLSHSRQNGQGCWPRRRHQTPLGWTLSPGHWQWGRGEAATAESWSEPFPPPSTDPRGQVSELLGSCLPAVYFSLVVRCSVNGQLQKCVETMLMIFNSFCLFLNNGP